MSAVYLFSTLLISVHAIQLSLKFTVDCLIFPSSNKYQWNKRWINCSWRWQLAINLRSIKSSGIKHHLDQREAWEQRNFCCGARRKGANYNKHQQDWYRGIICTAYSPTWARIGQCMRHACNWTVQLKGLVTCHAWVIGQNASCAHAVATHFACCCCCFFYENILWMSSFSLKFCHSLD